METNKKKKAIIVISFIISIIILSIIMFIPHGIVDTIRNTIQKEEEYSFKYELKKYDINTNQYSILVTVTNPEGIETIEYPENKMILNCNGKKKIAFDYITEDMTDYVFKVKLPDEEVKEEKIQFEKPRTGKDSYKEVNGIYVNAPNIEEGLEKEFTRYLVPTGEGGELQPGKWITENPPDDWYDYKDKKWANIYVESNGVESYYVWIPRYAYKIANGNTKGNERTEVIFIDVYNKYKYKDEDTNTIKEKTWEELESEGYKIPEAFEWGNENGIEVSISGYWMSKYELSDLQGYTIDYNLTASMENFNVSNFKVNESKKEQITQYTYAINGEIQQTKTELENYSFTNATPDKDNVINVTALDEQGRIVGSMTKKLELTEVNEPNLDGFDKDTTFYVYWDEKGNEHNETPISEDPPKDWYNYTFASWANIVTRNNGLESYFVWIPRYQYRLDTTSQRTSVRFIQGTGIEVETGYQIPEAFTTETDDGQEVQLEGYWISKYELSTEEKEKRLDAELAVSSNLIRVKDIKGTLIDNAKTTEQVPKDGVEEETETVETPIALKYEYYLNGKKQDYEGTDNKEHYVYAGLESNKTYTINIIVREKESDKYVGSITKKVTTKKENAPEFEGFNLDKTYYVTYNEDGSPKIGDKVQLGENNVPINIPENWYDYSQSKWANIVVTDGTVEDGQIQENATMTSYFVWIPRYEYRILGDRAVESTANRRIEVNFLEGTDTKTTPGYQIPEAFWWDKNNDGVQTDDEQLKGYWISKYELSNSE